MAQAGIMQGMRCLITGASRGIGRAIALAYAKENADLILCSRSIDALKEVAVECLRNNAASVKIIAKDLSLAEDAKSLVEDVLSDSLKFLYGVDVLVNNAGMIVEGSAAGGDVDQWGSCFQVNLLSPMILTRMLSEKMRERKSGVIINIGSVAGLEGMTHGGVYSATKFGLRGWSLHSGLNLKGDNIKVTLISPGYVSTDMAKGAKIDFSKVIQPQDIAEAALLPIRTSTFCCPAEISVRVTGNCYL